MKSKNNHWIIWGTVALAVVGAGVFYGLRHSKDDAGPTYESEPVTRGSLSASVTASGTLSPLVTVEIGSQVSGRIQELNADFNSQVKKGQVIAKIDPQTFQSEVAKMRASLIAGKAAVDRAQAELTEAKSKYERTSSLAAQGYSTAAESDAALAANQTAQAGLASAKASIEQIKAAMAQADANLAYTTIVSPIDGVVISRDVDVGQVVAASLQAPKLFTIAGDLREMEVHTSVAESDVGRVTPGLPVEFVVDAYPSERFKGTVKEVRYSPTTVQNVVTYDAVVSVANPDLKLRPGMTADVTFVVEERKDVLMIPNAALRFLPPADVVAQADPTIAKAKPGGRPGRGKGGREKVSERVVWKLGAGGVLSPVRIAVGISDGHDTEVVSGLNEKDAVVVGSTDPTAAGGAASGGAPGGGAPGGKKPSFGRFL